jgi:lipopolysaccharide biosynthesis glycosyltransferase
MANPIAIACGIDGNYAVPLAATIRSVLAHLSPGQPVTFYILDGGVSPADRKRLQATAACEGASLVWVRPSHDQLSDLPPMRGMSLPTYYRLLLDELLPVSVTKVIWLDSDLLVVHDLAELDAIDLGSHAVLAAQDMVIPYVSDPLGVADWRELGLAPDLPLFNAGVMVINLDLWRKEKLGAQLLDYVHRHTATIALHDQEALNAVLAGRWAPLDERWNCIASVAGRNFFKESPSHTVHSGDEAWILHFAGDWKPWTLPYGRHPYELFYRYLDQTPWAGWRPGNSMSRRCRAFYHEHLRDFLYPIENLYTNFRYRRLV